MADIPFYVLSFIVMLGVLVTIHEWGHLIVARWSGVRVFRFSIGFGRPLIKWTGKNSIEYVIGWLPLGGYVLMDEEPGSTRAAPVSKQRVEGKTFGQIHPLWRISIAGAGPAANFILAFLLFWVVIMLGAEHPIAAFEQPQPDSPLAEAGIDEPFMVYSVDGKQADVFRDVAILLSERLGDSGELILEIGNGIEANRRDIVVPLNNWLRGAIDPNLFDALGMAPRVIPAVGDVVPGSAAERGGLQTGDIIVSVGSVEVNSFNALRDEIAIRPDVLLTLGIIRDGQSRNLEVRPDRIELENGDEVGRLGFSSLLILKREAPLAALANASSQTWDRTVGTLGVIEKMVTGKVSVKNLGGPITIARLSGDSLRYSVVSFLELMALLSISLGVLNLLPIPILDGGRIVMHTLEWIKGGELPERALSVMMQLGLVFVIGFMIMVFYTDLQRLSVG